MGRLPRLERARILALVEKPQIQGRALFEREGNVTVGRRDLPFPALADLRPLLTLRMIMTRSYAVFSSYRQLRARGILNVKKARRGGIYSRGNLYMCCADEQEISSTPPTLNHDAKEDASNEKDAPPQNDDPSNLDESGNKHDMRFWLVFVALCFSLLLAALDSGGVGTAAPTIIHQLHGSEFTWVASAYNLASAAVLPLSGNLAEVFGRKIVLLCFLFTFGTGSAIAGAAPSMTVLIVGRAVQGLGGGGIQSLTYIVVADLVPLRTRGLFNGIIGLMWTFGIIAGPFIAGLLSEDVSWRWLFYLNLPLCGIAIVIVMRFLAVSIPRDSIKDKLRKIDWIGNILIISSATACMIGLTWGGVKYSWTSPRVLAPLLIGVVGLCLAALYEYRYASHPTIPPVIVSNKSSLVGYFASFIHGVIIMNIGFYFPTWFQSVKVASPILSGLYFLPMTMTISPFGIVEGIIVAKTGRFRAVNIVGWVALLLGLGLLTSLRLTTSIGVIAVYQLIVGIGLGLLFATTFVVLAPLPITENASALALLSFVRSFAQAWGAAITGAILQNGLRSKLPSSVLSQFPEGTDLAYGLIPQIPNMEEQLKTEVRSAFLYGMRNAWIVMVVLSGVGFLSSILVKDMILSNSTHKKWNLKPGDSEEPRSSLLDALLLLHRSGPRGTMGRTTVCILRFRIVPMATSQEICSKRFNEGVMHSEGRNDDWIRTGPEQLFCDTK
ncbi:hypothetical protein D9758_012263 [Tetrapyrgos nigripes]|uniref:Major facilitator superfamily (MFS) profile domain-containing protein n=1 Tax=Tetrapyrgos nigripes TaxID=182062 RepID=A0A8H5FL99_9AGAR|nr:hypothetical protein D9758_012263 [Tetrapyrgos nigripes]